MKHCVLCQRHETPEKCGRKVCVCIAAGMMTTKIWNVGRKRRKKKKNLILLLFYFESEARESQAVKLRQQTMSTAIRRWQRRRDFEDPTTYARCWIIHSFPFRHKFSSCPCLVIFSLLSPLITFDSPNIHLFLISVFRWVSHTQRALLLLLMLC